MAWRLTRAAEADIVDIYVYGARKFGFDLADEYHRGLEEIFEFLAANPRAARERVEIHPPVRIHPYRAHIVVYRVAGEDVSILRVRHGRENWDSAPQ